MSIEAQNTAAQRNHADLWGVAHLLLGALSRFTALYRFEAFAQVRGEAVRLHRAFRALLRRLLHLLALDLVLGPVRAAAPSFKGPTDACGRRSSQVAAFAMVEAETPQGAARSDNAEPSGLDPAAADWMVLLSRLALYRRILSTPQPYAARLARRFARDAGPRLRPVPLLRATERRGLGPVNEALDAACARLDPLAWRLAPLDTS